MIGDGPFYKGTADQNRTRFGTILMMGFRSITIERYCAYFNRSREPGVPLLIKALPVLATFYVISPLDFMPDFLPVLGQLDDLGVILIAFEVFLTLCPAGTVDFHRAAMAQGHKYYPMPSAGEVIDAEFRREEDVR